MQWENIYLDTSARKVQSSTVLVLSAAFAFHFPPSLTVHALLTQHGRLGILGPQAGGVRRADLLRAGRAAAVVHLGLIDVRQEALVAVLIYTHRHCGVTVTDELCCCADDSLWTGAAAPTGEVQQRVGVFQNNVFKPSDISTAGLGSIYLITERRLSA